MGKNTLRLAGAGIAAMLACSAPASGERASLTMLDQLDAGRWELRLRDSGIPAERMCISNGRRFIQLRHPEVTCERLVVEDGPSEVTVQYTCRGQGYGRTSIRRETNRLLQIQSQGIRDGLPFEFSAEARRVGNCSG
ncbi:hypothetical protein [Novosphingobium sp.]|uniref:hypothetical protein n=1 Tax=Novosphingobium sp. TaxID=1874826 RepID=UPI0027362DA2|nr:hypothetical protein [Novosphingobium sp.]MDP3906355.1 hypothetical protein [Novosphingobium sp.]